jgi:uncharacterized membrane protein YedE/YeeE
VLGLSRETWLWFAFALAIGLVFFFSYGYWRSKPEEIVPADDPGF